MNKERYNYEKSINGNLNLYAGMLGSSFQSRINQLSQILRKEHYPSIGQYKERLLLNELRKFLPQKYDVGTGFILFPGFKRNGPEVFTSSNHDISTQLDIIVYDRNLYAPIFKDLDFVVVTAESVRSVVEIKGTLSYKSAKESIRSMINLGKKWFDFSKDYEEYTGENLRIPHIHILNWNKYIRDDGNEELDGTKLRNLATSEYNTYFSKFEYSNKFPMVKHLYLFNDFMVRIVYTSNNMQIYPYCYYTTRGKILVEDYKGNLEFGDDKTFASLLSSIYASIESPMLNTLEDYDNVSFSPEHEHRDSGESFFDFWK